jgi:hypothetical protein
MPTSRPSPSPSTTAHTRRPGRRRAVAAASVMAGWAALVAAAPPASAATSPPIVVRNTNSNGPDSLRDAINTSNRQAGKQTITFDIPGSGPQVITPLTDLPQIVDAVVIDGYSQPGASAATSTSIANPLIVIDGRNLSNGLDIASRGSEIRGLVINDVGNDGAAVYLGSGSRNVIAGNYFGTGANGFQAQPNAVGVRIGGESSDNTVGGPDPADRNLISANTYAQVQLASRPGNVVQGNYIGTNATGKAALSSTAGSVDNFGVLLASSGHTVTDNVIANMFDGAEVWGDDEIITGNLFGLDAAGTAAIPNSIAVVIEGGDRNVVGGTAPGAGNVISGSAYEGISIEVGDLEAGFDAGPAVGTLVQGNKVGTDITGTAAVPNDTVCACTAGIAVASGPATIGGTTPGAANLVAGNKADGIDIVNADVTGTKVHGNLIGTDAAGTPTIGNGGSGVRVFGDASDNAIGGLNPGEGNTIADNGADGVRVESGTGNAILGNAIRDNGALGIDLDADGVTRNDTAAKLDADTGANGRQNFPVVTGVTGTGVDWTLDTEASRTYRVEFFGTTCDGSGHGEGATYLGSAQVTTDGAGHAAGTTTVAAPATGQVLTATATLLVPIGKFIPVLYRLSSTSEFSACR